MPHASSPQLAGNHYATRYNSEDWRLERVEPLPNGDTLLEFGPVKGRLMPVQFELRPEDVRMLRDKLGLSLSPSPA